MTTRAAAVAGMFYPDEPTALHRLVTDLLTNAPVPSGRSGPSGKPPKALIAPHAGYVYSGPIAAAAYRCLAPAAGRIRRVVLLGPAHRVYLTGMAFPSATAFEFPGGSVTLDRTAIEQALALPGTCISDDAHAQEHCLEVHLPFLAEVLDDFVLVPIVVGHCPAEYVARVLEQLWGGEETLVVVSSDLSHYHAYPTAQAIDAQTTAKILDRHTALTGEEACGAHAINGLMLAARAHELTVSALDVRNSGDTAGDRRQVVGYGAYVLR